MNKYIYKTYFRFVAFASSLYFLMLCKCGKLWVLSFVWTNTLIKLSWLVNCILYHANSKSGLIKRRWPINGSSPIWEVAMRRAASTLLKVWLHVLQYFFFDCNGYWITGSIIEVIIIIVYKSCITYYFLTCTSTTIL